MYVENMGLFRDIATKGAYVKYWTVDISIFDIYQFLILGGYFRLKITRVRVKLLLIKKN